MKLQIGPVPEGRREDWWAVQSTVFAFEFKDDERTLFDAATEWDRTLAAWDGDLLVGSAASLSFRMTVPGGGDVPTAGLTAVSVLPTHRRSGALTGMMRASFEDARDHGEPLAALLASESAIYGRFGYGVGAHEVDLSVARSDAVLRAGPPATGRVRLVGAHEARRIVPGLQRAATSGMGIPGSIHRPDPRWDIYFHDPEHWREGASPKMWGVYENGAGEPRGFVRYRVKEKWDDALPRYTLQVHDLHALDPEAGAALFTYCFGIDLVSEIKIYHRRPNEAIFEMLADPRRVGRVIKDGLWVRLVDVPAALAARRYRVEGAIVLEVQDDFCPWNDGRYLLEGGPDGASCTPTDAAADLRIGVADLASAYLGDVRLGAQRWAGRVRGEPGAVARASLMFSWDEEPWNTVGF